MFIYHFKRANMLGNRLIPLNRQRESMPEVFNEHIRKYAGREKLLEKRVPLIDCFWNDVLHFSPINPQIILDVFRKENLVNKENEGRIYEVYKVPISKLDLFKAVCFESFNYDFDNYSPENDKFWWFSEMKYQELNEVPLHQIKIWHGDFEAGRALFWYSHIMHILYPMEIDISDCEVIKCT